MATSTTSRIEQDSLPQPTLYLAFELGQNTWKLGFTIGVAQQPRERTIPAGALETLQQEIARAKQRLACLKTLESSAATRRAATDSGCTAPWWRIASRTTSSMPLVLRSIGANAGPRPIGSMSARC